MNQKEINKYIKSNIKLFHDIAYRLEKYMPTFARAFEHDEIFQTVVEESILALKKYKVGMGSNIPNYLYHTAYYGAARYLKANFSLIKRPMYLLENATAYVKLTRVKDYSDKEAAEVLGIPECRMNQILNVLKSGYEPLTEVFLNEYKSYDSECYDFRAICKLNNYIKNRIRNWSKRDLDVLKYLILKEGNETIKTLSNKYKVSHNCIFIKKKGIIKKLQKMILNYNNNIKEEFLSD